MAISPIALPLAATLVAPPGEKPGPLYNRASVMRGWNADNTVAKNIPRFKFSFFMDIKFHDKANIGSLRSPAGRSALNASVKAVDMPTVSYEIETLPQYNRVHNLIKKQNRNDITITFFDDTTSFVRGLLAAYRNHYTFASLAAYTPIQNGFALNPTRRPGDPIQPVDDGYPSTGLKPVTDPFFTAISLYDMGSEPSSANIYHIVRPVIKEITSGGFDYGDNDSPREITVTFAYEELIEHIGVNWPENARLADLPFVYEDSTTFTEAERAIRTGSYAALARAGIFQPDNNPAQDDMMEAMRKSLLAAESAEALERSGAGPGELLIAIQKSINGGEINFEDLQENVFRALARGTAIQNIRIAVRKALLVRQAIEQGRFLDIVPLLGAGWDQIRTFSWDTVGTTIDSVVGTIQGAVPGAGSWVEGHINGLQLPKLGGVFGG